MSWSFKKNSDGTNTVTLSAKPGDKINCPTYSELQDLCDTFPEDTGTAKFISGGGEKEGYTVSYSMPYGVIIDPNYYRCLGSNCPCLAAMPSPHSILVCAYSDTPETLTSFWIHTKGSQIFTSQKHEKQDTCCYGGDCSFELIDPPPQ